tara:strand:- start:519 stop:854 length:336 start_codon:yes stop_codon:yes gene_type:complete
VKNKKDTSICHSLLKFFEENDQVPKKLVEEFSVLVNKVYEHVEDVDTLWQKGGNHYKDFKIQPSQFINENKIMFAEGNVLKYICRHSKKGKAEDIRKAIHYCEMILERDYE